MKILIAILIGVLLCTSCNNLTSRRIKSGINIRNVGMKNIGLTEVTLWPEENQELNILEPYGIEIYSKTEIGFYQGITATPLTIATLSWRNFGSNRLITKRVKVNLPREFYALDYPSTLIFEINSNNSNITVLYKYYSETKGDFIIRDK